MSIIQGVGSGEVSTGFYPFPIGQSLRFNAGDSAFLSRTTGSATNTFTFSTWLKRGDISAGDFQYIFSSGASGLAIGQASNATLKDRFYVHDGSSNQEADPLIRDPSSWYHVVLSANSGTGVLYINGESVKTGISVASLSTGSGLTRIGRFGDGSFYLDAYLAETHLVTGSALTPSSFGETKNDIWVAKAYTGSHGDDGFKLTYADSSDIGNDSSGENHDLTNTNLTASDVVNDSPTNNHATLGAQRIITHTLSEGRLKSTNTSGTHGGTTATFNYPTSGKWYHEVTINSTDSSTGNGAAIGNQIDRNSTDWGNYANLVGYLGNGQKTIESGRTSYGSAQANNNIIGVAYNADDQELEFYLASSAGQTATSQGTIPTSEMDGVLDFNNLCPIAFGRNTTTTFNFGQSAFNGTDGSGTLPTGFKALNTANLPDPVIDPNKGETPDQYFNSVLWTGNNSSRSITGVGFQPDWVWIKNRLAANSHALTDSVRGVTKELRSNSTAKEQNPNAQALTAFDADGFSIGTDGAYNTDTETYVAWCWKAGTTFSNSGGSNDATIASTGSVSVEAGFSIVSYTGDGNDNAKFFHGLTRAPELVILKDRDNDSTNWRVGATAIDSSYDQVLNLNLANQAASASTIFSAVAPTANVITLGTEADANGIGRDFICYCFASREQYLKIGTYEGNNSTDNAFVFTGFRPAFLMIKNVDATGNWGIWDIKRDTFNVSFHILRADTTDTEGTAQPNNNIDILSNGFKVRGNTGVSGDAVTYFYMAFAEQPFKYANAR